MYASHGKPSSAYYSLAVPLTNVLESRIRARLQHFPPVLASYLARRLFRWAEWQLDDKVRMVDL